MVTYDFRDMAEGETLLHYLYSHIRADILRGVLAPGEKLPSKRTLAENLGVSVITVENTYAQLLAEGYISSVPRKGFFVEHIRSELLLPEGELAAAEAMVQRKRNGMCRNSESRTGEMTDVQTNGRDAKEIFTNGTAHDQRGDVISQPESRRGNENVATIPTSSISKWIDLVSSRADPGKFPFQVWARLMRETLSERQAEVMERSPSKGVEQLRMAIDEYLFAYRSIRVKPEQIVIGAGTEYLYSLIIQMLGRERVYGVENPGYPATAAVYENHGVEVRYLPMDSDGVCADRSALSGVDVLHITPSHQFPTGITMPIRRRMDLLDWASQGHIIIEDDYDSEFRLAGRPIPSLSGIDASGNVIYLNTFTRSLGPTFRISYMVLPERLLPLYQERIGFYSNTVSNLQQYTLAEFIGQGYFEKHINRMRTYYRQRRDRLVQALSTSPLAGRIRIEAADSGLHLILCVGDARSEQELSALARRQGVNIRGVSDYLRQPQQEEMPAEPDQAGSKADMNWYSKIEHGKARMVVNYPGLTDEEMDELGGRLASAWK